MRFFCPLAYFATLSLVVYLALSATAAVYATETGEAEPGWVDAYRAHLLTPDEERAVGQRLAYLYEQRYAPVNDAEMQARLDRVTSRLSEALPGLTLEVKIIRSARPEAVSFTPGRIYITSALLKITLTDDALAAVIAHEAAHIADHHLARLIALTLALPLNERERFPTRRAIVTGQALQFTFPSILDDARLRCEMEADKIALRLLERAGYRTEALATLLDNLSKRLSPHARQERAATQARIALLTEQRMSVRKD